MFIIRQAGSPEWPADAWMRVWAGSLEWPADVPEQARSPEWPVDACFDGITPSHACLGKFDHIKVEYFWRFTFKLSHV